MHELTSHNDDNIKDVENAVFNYILEHHIIDDSSKCKCSKCELSSVKYENLNSHTQTAHQSPIVEVNRGSEKYAYGCDLCEFGDNLVGNVWKHKLTNHSGTFNFNSSDENVTQDLLFNLV